MSEHEWRYALLKKSFKMESSSCILFKCQKTDLEMEEKLHHI